MGSRRVTARIPDSEVDHADDLMRGHPEVGDVSVEQGLIRFTIGGDGSVSASLLREMVESGIEVAEWRVESAGLEELFMRITDDGKAEAESG